VHGVEACPLLVRNRKSFDFTITRTVKFLQKFQSSDNRICNLFSKKAEISVKNIFSQRGSQIHNVYDLKNFFENTFFGNDP